MKWTKEFPTRPGWYWWTGGGGRPMPLGIVEVFEGDDGLKLNISAYVDAEAMPLLRGYETDNRLWAGPIEAPT